MATLLYVDSLLRSEATLHAILGIAVAVPLFALVAAILGHSFSRARRETLKFVREWVAVAPTEMQKALRLTFATSLPFAFMIGTGWVCDRIGDFDPLMPALSRPFAFFGYEDTRWSWEHIKEWKAFEDHLATAWEASRNSPHPEQQDAWVELKNNTGKNKVRASRSLAVMSMLVMIAGLVDIAKNRAFRSRGLALLGTGIFLVVIFTAIWVNERSIFIRRLMDASATLGSRAVHVPQSFPR